MMKIFLGADHGGYELKEKIKKYLQGEGYDVEDVGASSMDPDDDYVDYAAKVARKVAAGDGFGILVCRSAAGMVIAANKIKGIRAVAAFDVTSAKHSREHNDANVLALSGDWTKEDDIYSIIDAWLATDFSNEERHARRLKKIGELE